MNIKIIDEPKKAVGNSFGNLVIRFAIVKFNDVKNKRQYRKFFFISLIGRIRESSFSFVGTHSNLAII